MERVVANDAPEVRMTGAIAVEPDDGRFARERSRLFGLAYRMLGSVADAEDAVQETYLRWRGRSQSMPVRDAAGFLVATCTRLCIDELRSARRRRLSYVGPWLPDPLVEPQQATQLEGIQRRESLSAGFLLLLERLGPNERAAFVLAEAFDFDGRRIAALLGKSEAATRQILSRAKRKLGPAASADAATGPVDEAAARSFLAALDAGDAEAMLRLLRADARLASDGGGKVVAARNWIVGRERIARFLIGIATKWRGHVTADAARINGAPGMILRLDQTIFGTLALDLAGDGHIRTIYMMRNPAKLRHIA